MTNTKFENEVKRLTVIHQYIVNSALNENKDKSMIERKSPISLKLKVGDLTADKILAIEHAVNNHDALVDALSNVVEKVVYNNQGLCPFCFVEVGVKHEDNCDYISAVNLLDKIKGDLK